MPSGVVTAASPASIDKRARYPATADGSGALSGMGPEVVSEEGSASTRTHRRRRSLLRPSTCSTVPDKVRLVPLLPCHRSGIWASCTMAATMPARNQNPANRTLKPISRHHPPDSLDCPDRKMIDLPAFIGPPASTMKARTMIIRTIAAAAMVVTLSSAT